MIGMIYQNINWIIAEAPIKISEKESVEDDTLVSEEGILPRGNGLQNVAKFIKRRTEHYEKIKEILNTNPILDTREYMVKQPEGKQYNTTHTLC